MSKFPWHLSIEKLTKDPENYEMRPYSNLEYGQPFIPGYEKDPEGALRGGRVCIKLQLWGLKPSSDDRKLTYMYHELHSGKLILSSGNEHEFMVYLVECQILCDLIRKDKG